MKGAQIRYSPEELAWVEANKELPRAQMAKRFSFVFEREDVTVEHLKSLCSRRGWKSGRTGHFQPGQTPMNKGKKMPFHPKSAATRFKKGGMSGRARERYKPIGTERTSKDGYVERKIHDGLPLQSRWRAVHLIRWEEINGPLPKGHALKCLNGDRSNTDPENWEAIPRALLPRLSGRRHMAYDSAPDEMKPTLLAIAKLEHRARTARKGEA